MGEPVSFVEAMGVVPNVIVFPHFDRMAGFLDQNRFSHLLNSIPDQDRVIGVDEDTALVRIEPSETPDKLARWRVMGRQTVSIFDGDKKPRILRSGDEIAL